MPGEEPNVKFEPLPNDVTFRLRECFPHMDTPTKSNPGDLVMPASFQKFVDSIYNFPLDERDIWIVTYPKCGTTWTQEQIWLLANNGDFEGAKKESLMRRFPFLELTGLPSEEVLKMLAETGIDQNGGAAPMTPQEIAKLPSPRFVKTHLPFFLLPPKLLDTCKVIYVARNPKDVCVSWYHHHKLVKFQDTHAPFETFAEFFLKDQLMYSPYWPHIKSAWEMKNHPNLLFLFYEDAKCDLIGQLKKIAAFINKTYSEEDYKRMKEHLVIDNFKKNPSVNGEDAKKNGIFKQEGEFVRKGKTGNWKDYFTPELDVKFNAWIEANSQDTDLRFRYELESQD